MFNSKNGNSILESEKALLETLNDYKWLLSSDAYSYLEALIGLEISAYDPSIQDQEREVLKRLDLYKKVCIYNICMRTKRLLNNNSNGIILSTVENFNNPIEFNIYGNVNGTSFPVFAFDIEKENPKYIGDSDVYLSRINDELRKKEMDRLAKEAVLEEQKPNPHAIHDGITRKEEENAAYWEATHRVKLAKIKEDFNKLAKFYGLDKNAEEVLAAKNYLGNLILSDMHLKESDFSPIQCKGMKKTLVKRYPGISIRANIDNI